MLMADLPHTKENKECRQGEQNVARKRSKEEQASLRSTTAVPSLFRSSNKKSSSAVACTCTTCELWADVQLSLG